MSFGGFGAATSSPAKPAFGSSFGGAGAAPAFGAAPAAAGGGSSGFGFPAAGAQKPAGSTAAFGSSIGGFGAAPAASGFGAAPAASGFGSSTGGFGAPSASTGFGATPAAGAGTSAFGAPPAGSSFGFTSASTAFPSNALGGGVGSAYGALGNTAPQQSQWIGGQKLADISMAYASKVDGSGKPVEVSTEKKDTAAPAAQPAAQPATTTWSFASATPAAAAPVAAAQPAINKLCEFEFIAYNSSSNYKQKPYVRPPHVGYRRWLQADRDNPDPDNLTPVLVVGCDGLKKRFSSQCTKAEKIKSYTDGLKEQLELLERSADGAALRYEELKERQRKYFMRLLQVMRKLEVLRAKGISLTPVETRYREKVEELTSAIMVPYEKIQSLESSQAILERQKESFAGPASVSESDFESLCAVLAKQRDGLKHLTDIVKKDARDVAIMEQIISDTSVGRRY